MALLKRYPEGHALRQLWEQKYQALTWPIWTTQLSDGQKSATTFWLDLDFFFHHLWCLVWKTPQFQEAAEYWNTQLLGSDVSAEARFRGRSAGSASEDLEILVERVAGFWAMGQRVASFFGGLRKTIDAEVRLLKYFLSFFFESRNQSGRFFNNDGRLKTRDHYWKALKGQAQPISLLNRCRGTFQCRPQLRAFVDALLTELPAAAAKWIGRPGGGAARLAESAAGREKRVRLEEIKRGLLDVQIF